MSPAPVGPPVLHHGLYEEKSLGTKISKEDLEFTDAGFRYKIKMASRGGGETEDAAAGEAGTMSRLCRVKTWRYAFT